MSCYPTFLSRLKAPQKNIFNALFPLLFLPPPLSQVRLWKILSFFILFAAFNGFSFSLLSLLRKSTSNLFFSNFLNRKTWIVFHIFLIFLSFVRTFHFFLFFYFKITFFFVKSFTRFKLFFSLDSICFGKAFNFKSKHWRKSKLNSFFDKNSADSEKIVHFPIFFCEW